MGWPLVEARIESSSTVPHTQGMHQGIYLPPFAELADPKRVVALATTAEEAGWDGLFLWDHMLAGPGIAVADPWVTMAAIATMTTRIRFGALVTPLSRRRPWVLSRQLATLDQLSTGRLVAGIGLGDESSVRSARRAILLPAGSSLTRPSSCSNGSSVAKRCGTRVAAMPWTQVRSSQDRSRIPSRSGAP